MRPPRGNTGTESLYGSAGGVLADYFIERGERTLSQALVDLKDPASQLDHLQLPAVFCKPMLRLAEGSANRTHQRRYGRRTVLKTAPDTSPDCLPDLL